MPLILRIVLLCSLALSALAQAAPEAPQAAPSDCGEYSQAQMRACLAGKVQESEKALRQAEKNMRAALLAWDEDRLYGIRAASALKAANRAFVSYRRDTCALAQSLSGGAAGNAAELRRLTCEATLNGRRAAELEQQAAGLPAR